jgi:hypothetical protein
MDDNYEFEQMRLYDSLEEVVDKLVASIPDRGIKSKLKMLLVDYRQCGYSSKDYAKSKKIYSTMIELVTKNASKMPGNSNFIVCDEADNQMNKLPSEEDKIYEKLSRLEQDPNDDFNHNFKKILGSMNEIKSNIYTHRNYIESKAKDKEQTVKRDDVKDKPLVKAKTNTESTKSILERIKAKYHELTKGTSKPVVTTPKETVSIPKKAGKVTYESDPLLMSDDWTSDDLNAMQGKALRELSARVLKGTATENDIKQALNIVEGKNDDFTVSSIMSAIDASQLSQQFDMDNFIKLAETIKNDLPNLICQSDDKEANAELKVFNAAKGNNLFINYEKAYKEYNKNADKYNEYYQLRIEESFPNGRVPSTEELRTSVNLEVKKIFEYQKTYNLVDNNIVDINNVTKFRNYIKRSSMFMNDNELIDFGNQIINYAGNIQKPQEATMATFQVKDIIVNLLISRKENNLQKDMSLQEKAQMYQAIFKERFNMDIAPKDNPYLVLLEEEKSKGFGDEKLKKTANQANAQYANLRQKIATDELGDNDESRSR